MLINLAGGGGGGGGGGGVRKEAKLTVVTVGSGPFFDYLDL